MSNAAKYQPNTTTLFTNDDPLLKKGGITLEDIREEQNLPLLLKYLIKAIQDADIARAQEHPESTIQRGPVHVLAMISAINLLDPSYQESVIGDLLGNYKQYIPNVLAAWQELQNIGLDPKILHDNSFHSSLTVENGSATFLTNVNVSCKWLQPWEEIALYTPYTERANSVWKAHINDISVWSNGSIATLSETLFPHIEVTTVKSAAPELIVPQFDIQNIGTSNKYEESVEDPYQNFVGALTLLNPLTVSDVFVNLTQNAIFNHLGASAEEIQEVIMMFKSMPIPHQQQLTTYTFPRLTFDPALSVSMLFPDGTLVSFGALNKDITPINTTDGKILSMTIETKSHEDVLFFIHGQEETCLLRAAIDAYKESAL